MESNSEKGKAGQISAHHTPHTQIMNKVSSLQTHQGALPCDHDLSKQRQYALVRKK